MINEELDLNNNYLSLVSHTKNHIHVEIILDNNLENHKMMTTLETKDDKSSKNLFKKLKEKKED